MNENDVILGSRQVDEIARVLARERTGTNWPQMEVVVAQLVRIFGLDSRERARFERLAGAGRGKW
jgi:hypothetical protein